MTEHVASNSALAQPPSSIEAALASLQAQVESLQAQLDAAHQVIANLTHENMILKRRLFGNSTERMNTVEAQLSFGDIVQDQAALDEALEQAAADAADDAAGEQKPAGEEADNEAGAQSAGGGDGPPSGKRGSGRGRRDLSKSDLPREIIEISDKELEQQGKRIGYEDSYQIMRVFSRTVILVKRIIKYEIQGKNGPTILAASAPRTLFRRGILHSSAVAHLVVQKFDMGTPFYRQERQLIHQGCPIDRATMCRYAEDAGNTLGVTICAAMWADALTNGGVIATDATGALIQPEKRKNVRQSCMKGHFFTAVVDNEYILFAYTPKHTQAAVHKLFHGFGGYLQADASNVYDILDRGPPESLLFEDDEPCPTLVGCWAHCRRYFFEAAICRYPIGTEGLKRIRAMYKVDANFQKLPPSKRKKLRKKHLRPLMDDFFRWVEQQRSLVPGRDHATKALGYAHNQRIELERVLDDPRLPLDNTRSERAVRFIVVGRKNWMFYGSDVHAEAAAAFFTLIATCRLHSIDPETYLDEVLRLLPYWPKDRYLELAPHVWKQTRAKLDPDELAAKIGTFTVPEAE